LVIVRSRALTHAGFGYRRRREASTWFGIGAPEKTPAEIVDKLNKEVNAGLTDPKMIARLADLGGLPMPLTPAEFGKFIADDLVHVPYRINNMPDLIAGQVQVVFAVIPTVPMPPEAMLILPGLALA
jgi:hypothetical protein